MNDENVSGDRGVLIRLFRVVPADQTLKSFIENNAGRLICVDETAINPAQEVRIPV